MTFQVPKKRLDHYLAEKYPDISRAFLQKLCNSDQVLVNKNPEKSGFKLKSDDKVNVLYDMASIEKIEDIQLPILYEDEQVMVIDKPAGVISHARGRYWNEPSVASFIRQKTMPQHSGRISKEASWKHSATGDRAGIVHRLDRATSGVMICAKNQETMKYLQKQFANRSTKKTYIAIVNGHLDPLEAIIDMPIERNPKAPSTFRVGSNGKPAQTVYKVIRSTKIYNQVQLKPATGRTHQLRVHLKHLGYPIVGDTLYGGEPAERLMLHAKELAITLPDGQARRFVAALPKEFAVLMKVSPTE